MGDHYPYNSTLESIHFPNKVINLEGYTRAGCHEHMEYTVAQSIIWEVYIVGVTKVLHSINKSALYLINRKLKIVTEILKHNVVRAFKVNKLYKRILN